MSAPNNHAPLKAEEVAELLRRIGEKDGWRTHFRGERCRYWLEKLAPLDADSEKAFDLSKLNDYVKDKTGQRGFVVPTTLKEKDICLQQMRTGVAALRRALLEFYREYYPEEKAIPTVRGEIWRLIWEFDRKAPAREITSDPEPPSNWLVEPLRNGSGEIAFYLPVNDRGDVPKRFAVFGDPLEEHFPGIEKRLRSRVLGPGETLSLAGHDTVLAIGPLRWNLAAMELLASAGRQAPALREGQGRVMRLAVGRTTVVIIEAEDTARATVLLRRVVRGEGGVERVGADGYLTVDLPSSAIVAG